MDKAASIQVNRISLKAHGHDTLHLQATARARDQKETERFVAAIDSELLPVSQGTDTAVTVMLLPIDQCSCASNVVSLEQ